jgi:hypothetical protein
VIGGCGSDEGAPGQLDGMSSWLGWLNGPLVQYPVPARPGPCSAGCRPPGAVLSIGVGEELSDGADGGMVQLVQVVAEAVELTSDLGGRSGQGAPGQTTTTSAPLGYSAQKPWRLRAEQVGIASGMSPVRWDDPEVATKTLVIATGWPVLRRSRPG